MNFRNKKLIIWDWNGTLLDDVALCVSCINEVMTLRKLPPISISRYRDIFTFPVKDYYVRAGFNFDLEEFEKPAMEFIDLYYQRLDKADLFACVPDVLDSLSKKGYRQLVLSAMEHGKLVASLKSKGIFNFFDNVSGLVDHYARSKVDIGRELVNNETLKKDEMLLIGDSLHDLEVAVELRVDCALVANGHQSMRRLKEHSDYVFEKLLDVIKAIEEA